MTIAHHKLSKFWNWLITPFNPPSQPDRLHRARLLSAMLLVTLVLGVPIEVLTHLSNASFNDLMNWQTAVLFIGLLAAYLINQNGAYRLAVWITVSLLTAGIFLLTFNTGGLPVDTSFLCFLFIPLMFASVFLPEGSIYLLTGVFLAGMALAGVVSQLDVADILLGPGSFIAMAGGIIYLIMHYRNILETERQRDLVEREERYRSLFEGANDAIFLISLDNTYLNLNQKAAEMMGYTREEITGLPVSIMVAPRDYGDTLAVREDLLDGKVVPTYERTLVRKDGREIPVEVNVSLLRNRNGKPQAIQSIVRDVSDRKQAEARLQGQIDRLNALREIDLMITTSPDLRVTLQFLLHQAVARLEMAAGDILLYKPGLNQLEIFTTHGYSFLLARYESIPLNDPLGGQAAARQRPVCLPHLAASPPDAARLLALAGQGLVSACAVPLLVKDQVKGVLEVFSAHPFEPAPDWLDFLETLGGQAAIAVESAEMFQNVQRSNQEMLQSYDATLKGWAAALELRDKETRGHSDNVTSLAVRLGQILGLDENALVHLRRGALLHDIGKMGIPDEILRKPGALNDAEWAEMKKHPTYAAGLLAGIPFLQSAIDIPLYHHERWDGSGYPLGLAGKNIPLAARIFMVADIWDALISDRSYRKAWTHAQAVDYLRQQAGVQLDPEIVPVFLKLIES